MFLSVILILIPDCCRRLKVNQNKCASKIAYLYEEREFARPMKYIYKTQEKPLLQRKTVRNKLIIRKEEKKPKLSKALEKKIAETQEPTSDGYELNQLMSGTLESELQDIMIKVWQELPDSPPPGAEQIVADKFRNEAGDDLKNALGLNVTKRILNVHNQLYIKIEFDTQPYGPCMHNFLRWLNCSAMRRVLGGQHNYVALLHTLSDFDRVTSKGSVRIGTLKAKITPYYKFTKCPPKLKTIYKISKRPIGEKTEKDNQENKIKESTDANKKLGSTPETKIEAKIPTQVAKTEFKKTAPVAKTETKKTAQVEKTETKKTAPVAKTETKKTAPVAKTETMKTASVAKTETMKTAPVAKTETKKTALVAKTETKKLTQIAKTDTEKPTETTKPETPMKVEASKKNETNHSAATKFADKKTTVTKVTPTKAQGLKKDTNITKTTPQSKSKETKVTEKAKTKTGNTNKKTTGTKATPNKKKQRKQSDFDELNDEDILALMSDAIVLDECLGSDED